MCFSGHDEGRVRDEHHLRVHTLSLHQHLRRPALRTQHLPRLGGRRAAERLGLQRVVSLSTTGGASKYSIPVLV